jgi:hypothetical protein
MLFGGAQLPMLGIIGEYLGKVPREVKGRPSYIIREASEAPRPLGRRRHAGTAD